MRHYGPGGPQATASLLMDGMNGRPTMAQQYAGGSNNNYQSQNNFGLLYRGGVPQITGMSNLLYNGTGGEMASQLRPYQTEFGNSFQQGARHYQPFAF